jgi:outer membrane protein assembly factor BamB
MRRLIAVLVLTCLPLPAAASGDPQELFAAARAGRLDEVRRLIEAGVPVDATDKYGTSAMMMAASAGQPEVVRFLLEKGADASREETFYGATALSWMGFSGTVDEATRREIALLLLAHGAEDRDQVLGMAIQNGDLELARAAVESGPMAESTLARYTAGARNMDPALKQILDRAQTRPDPPAPAYTAAELEPFTGRYEGFATAAVVEVTLADDRLLLAIGAGEPEVLETTGERSFRTKSGATAEFFGRAGTIEGIQLSQVGVQPDSLRRSVAEPMGADAFTGAAQAEATAGESTVNWPAFRGPGASGVGDGVAAPVEWDVDSGEGVLWSAAIPGLGNSSPIVWGDRVFITTAVAEGAEQTIRTGLTGAGDPVDERVEHRWLVLAFDKGSGEKLWETEVGRAVPITKRHFKATQANSTPATDGKHLVVVFPTAGLACLGLDGEVHWKHELGGLNAGAFNDPGIEWGFASSPFIYGSLVIQQVDIHGGQYLAAWDLETGREVWRTERSVAPSWATPNILPGPDGDELVVNGSTIHGYDPATGKELWSLGPNSELVIATPVIGQGMAFVSAGYPPIKPIYVLHPGLRGDHLVDPVVGDESLVWSNGIGGAYMPTPLLYRGVFYVVHHSGRLVAYDALTGAALYKQRFSKGGTFTGSPIAVNGRIYAGTEEGRLYVLKAGAEYEELAVNDTGEPLMATPAVSAGVLFLRTPSRLIAVGEAPAEEAAS